MLSFGLALAAALFDAALGLFLKPKRYGFFDVHQFELFSFCHSESIKRHFDDLKKLASFL